MLKVHRSERPVDGYLLWCWRCRDDDVNLLTNSIVSRLIEVTLDFPIIGCRPIRRPIVCYGVGEARFHIARVDHLCLLPFSLLLCCRLTGTCAAGSQFFFPLALRVNAASSQLDRLRSVFVPGESKSPVGAQGNRCPNGVNEA